MSLEAEWGAQDEAWSCYDHLPVLTLRAQSVMERVSPGSGLSWRDELSWLWTHDRTTMQALLDSVGAEGFRSSIILGNDGRLWDGHHRLAAALELGVPVPTRTVPPAARRSTLTGRKAYARLFWRFIPSWAVPWADPCEEPHDVVVVDGVDLDVAIAPLVAELWRQGIGTYNSCQGDARLYRLYDSRHPATREPAGNPYSAYLTLNSLEAARAVVLALDPPPEHLATISTRAAAVPEKWWFVHFDPSLLDRWQGRSQESLDASNLEGMN